MESISERYRLLAEELVKHILKFFEDTLVSVTDEDVRSEGGKASQGL